MTENMKNKGITLVELIVSFALVGVSIIYFYRTLNTVSKIYKISRDETNNYIRKSYTLKLAKANIEKSKDICNNNEYCVSRDREYCVSRDSESCPSKFYQVKITYKDGKTTDSTSEVTLYYYKP